jgi:DNA polymerase-4
MDAFFASVEQRDRPELRGKPVVVGGRHRGVVAAASYEARRFGVHSAMPMTRALRLCPSLEVVPPDFARYKAVSAQVFALFHEVTERVEPLSLDEAYLDVSENRWGEALGVQVARRIKEEIRARTGLTASAGVAPNKFLAKIASGYRKPDGLTVISPERIEPFLQGLDVDALWGVGPVTAQKLRAAGIHKLVDVRRADPSQLRALVGSFAELLQALANGIDDRPVEPHRQRKSVGNETTFPEDLRDRDRLQHEARTMAEDGAAWLQSHSQHARTVTLKVRYHDFQTITRSHTAAPTDSGAELAERAVQLLLRTEAGTRPVRLLGVSLSGLCPQEEGPLPASAAALGEPAAPAEVPEPEKEESPQLSLPFAPSLLRPSGRRASGSEPGRRAS